MKKFLPKISWIATIVMFGLTQLITLFCGVLPAGSFRYGRCYGTGCYGAGNGTGAGYYRTELSLFGGMGLDDDFLALSIIFLTLMLGVTAFFVVRLLKIAKKKNFAPSKARLPILFIMATLTLTFAIYGAIEASYHAAAGLDVAAGFTFLLFFLEGGLIALEFLQKKFPNEDDEVVMAEAVESFNPYENE